MTRWHTECGRSARAFLLYGVVAATAALCSGCFSVGVSHLKLAETFRANEKYEAAIHEYQLFIDQRLQQPTASSLNPYFYYLLIGDCYLKLGRPDDAKSAYITAEEHDVEKPIVGGKFRSLAAWYSDQSRFEEAIAILHEHRQLDPLLFDLEIDRDHKAAIEAEDRERNGTDKAK